MREVREVRKNPRQKREATKPRAFLKLLIWMFPKIGVPQNGWSIMENPIKMDDLGVTLFSETSIYYKM